MILNNPILEFFVFIVIVIFFLYLPGKFFIKKLKIDLVSHEDIFFSTVFGLLIFTLVSYIFSWLQIRNLILYPFLLIDFITIKNRWFLCNFDKKHFFPILVASILSIIFSLSMVLGGQYGDLISTRRDDLWHLALINELRVNFPPDNPGFAGVPLRGYHFFYNFLLAQISNISTLSPLSLHFHFFPLLISFLWGSGVYALMYGWIKSRIAGLLAVFFTLFGGSFVFILHFQGYKSLSLDSGFGIMQPISTLMNPSFAISIIILLTAIFAMQQYLFTGKKTWLFPLILSAGLISMFKVYAGIVFLSGFLFLVVLKTVKKKFAIFIAFFAVGIIFLGTYWFFTDRSAHLIWFPFWAPHKVLIDNFPWYGYEEKIYTYSRLSVIKGLVETELYAWYIFLIGNQGTRIFGLLILPFLLIKNRKLPSLFAITVSVMTIASIIIPLFFIQTGKVFEIIQMGWYFLFFCSLFSAIGIAKLFTFKYPMPLKILLLIIVVIFTLPSAYENYFGYFKTFSSKESLKSPYYKAMNFLSFQRSYNSTVIDMPQENTVPDQKDLKSWYEKSSPAITAFANKRSYLNSEYIDFPGVNITSRIEFLKKIILFHKTSQLDNQYKNKQKEIEKGLIKDDIVFIYSPYPIQNLLSIKNIHQIFQNEVAAIYKFEKD